MRATMDNRTTTEGAAAAAAATQPWGCAQRAWRDTAARSCAAEGSNPIALYKIRKGLIRLRLFVMIFLLRCQM